MKFFISFLIVFVCVINSFAQDDIFQASREGDTKKTTELLKSNPKLVNDTNQNGHTPLILACYRAQPKMVEFLIKKGADVNYKSKDGAAIHGAAYKGDLEILKILIDHGAFIDSKDQNGTTPLLFATSAQHTECAVFLVEKGADTTIKDYRNQTALDLAKLYKNQTLIEKFSQK